MSTTISRLRTTWWPAVVIGIVGIAFGFLAHLAFFDDEPESGSATGDQAALVALNWVGEGFSDIPRREGRGWEIDVHRDDGSLVEVGLSADLRLRTFDEERGPGGTPAHDEVTGPARDRAIAAARRSAPAGAVRSVERERDGSLEVDVVRPGGSVVEVELDRRLRITDVDDEQLGDE